MFSQDGFKWNWIIIVVVINRLSYKLCRHYFSIARTSFLSAFKVSTPWHKLSLLTEVRNLELSHDGYIVDIRQDGSQPRVIYTLSLALPLSLQ